MSATESHFLHDFSKLTCDAILVWEHFPGEEILVRELQRSQRHDFCWLAPEWKRRRQAFLELCESSDVETAFEACSNLHQRLRAPLRIACTEESCLPMEAWWVVERWTVDCYRQDCAAMQLPWVAVHVESATYAAAAHLCTSHFLARHALCYLDPNAHVTSNFPRARTDANVPEIIAAYLYWIPAVQS